jgi:hypothetical protein
VTETRYPKPPMRFPGPARGRVNPPRRWILGHCDACTYPIVIAGLIGDRPWAAPVVKRNDTDIGALLEARPTWPAHAPFVATDHPTDSAPPAQPLDLTCGQCEVSYPGVTRAQLAAQAAPALDAGADRFTVVAP